MKRSQNMPTWLRRMVLANIFAQFAEAGKRHSKAKHLLKKSVINMIWLLLSVSDWPIIMSRDHFYDMLANQNNWSRCFAISNLPPICCPCFSFMGWVGKRYILKLDVRNILQGCILSTAWDTLKKVNLGSCNLTVVWQQRLL